MKRTVNSVICAAALVVASALAGCASTKMESTWRDPTVGQLTFKRVLVIALARDPAIRRAAEDELVQRITTAQAVPSYTVVPDAELNSHEAVRNRAQASGFDGVVVMRVAAVDKEATWVPGMTGPYYAFGGWAAYDPGHVVVDTYVRVETNVYSVPGDRLVWASASRTVNPSSVRGLVGDTTRAVAKAMKSEGLIP
jgi:hypothetical protein